MPSKTNEEAKDETAGAETSGIARAPATDFFPKPDFNPRAGRAKAAEGELKVMRNDLSDADLEVVRVGAGGNKNIPSGTAWGHLVSRIFGPGTPD